MLIHLFLMKNFQSLHCSAIEWTVSLIFSYLINRDQYVPWKQPWRSEKWTRPRPGLYRSISTLSSCWVHISHVHQSSCPIKILINVHHPFIQYAKLNGLLGNIPSVKLENGAEVTEEILLTSLRRALNQYSTLQAHDGHWPGDYSGILFIMPIFVSIFNFTFPVM